MIELGTSTDLIVYMQITNKRCLNSLSIYHQSTEQKQQKQVLHM